MDLVIFDNIIKFFLVLVRVSGFFITVPVLGSASVPTTTKISLALMVSFLIFPTLNLSLFYVPEAALALGGIILLELTLGVLLGFITMIITEGFRLAGQVTGIQLGFGMISVLDPESQIQESLMDVFFFFVFVLIFLALDYHQKFIIAMSESFELLPVGSLLFPQALLEDIIFKVSTSFVIGIKLSFPLLAPGVVIIVILGIISKTVPRMEVFLISFPLKIFLGFLMIYILLPLMPPFTEVLMDDLFEWVYSIMRMMQ